ncbi:MAG: hypothetical protein AAF211_18715 [Myxococcota bacterium]
MSIPWASLFCGTLGAAVGLPHGQAVLGASMGVMIGIWLTQAATLAPGPLVDEDG